jgi:hypothetical protein
MSHEDCDLLIDYMRGWEAPGVSGVQFPWEEGNNRYWQQIQNDSVRKAIMAYKFRLCHIASGFYRELLYPVFTDAVVWTPGKFMDAHADNGDGTPGREDLRNRKYTAVLYLNDDFVGGETFVLDGAGGKYSFKPVKGAALVLPSDERFLHGVDLLESGLRYTLPVWLTTITEDCEC